MLNKDNIKQLNVIYSYEIADGSCSYVQLTTMSYKRFCSRNWHEGKAVRLTYHDFTARFDVIQLRHIR